MDANCSKAFICWVLVAGEGTDEDLGIWRKAPVAVAAAAAR